MVDNNIVPIGKYKGRAIEEVLADTNYWQWFTSQPGIRERYAAFISVLVNGNATTDTPTPEHNRMQNLFLNPDVCFATHRSVMGEETFDKAIVWSATTEANKEILHRAEAEGNAAAIIVLNEEIARDIFKKQAKYDHKGRWNKFHHNGPDQYEWQKQLCKVIKEIPWLPSYDMSRMTIERKQEIEADDRQGEATLREIENAVRRIEAAAQQVQTATEEKLQNSSLKQHLVDEHIQRITGVIYHNNTMETEFRNWDIRLDAPSLLTLVIELKPVVGDDYPAILRTMKKRFCEPHCHTRCHDRCTLAYRRVLIVDNFAAEYTTLEQLKVIFAQSNIEVRTLAEIYAAMPLKEGPPKKALPVKALNTKEETLPDDNDNNDDELDEIFHDLIRDHERNTP